MHQPIISITIPTYNRGYLLHQTLSALCMQIDKNELHDQIEIVISDNFSSDNTREIVEGFANTNKYRIVYNKNEQNLGVIKNILKLVELSSGIYWMFYGDDDIIPEGALMQLILEFTTNSEFTAFMFKWPPEADEYCKTLNADHDFSFEQIAHDYFYYIGNAGIFAVKTENAKTVVEKYTDDLLNTCWPQTLILFIAVHSSSNKKIKFKNIVSSLPPSDVLVISNCYYLFETTIYSLLRTALSVEKITSSRFTDIALNSVYGIQHFEILKNIILERYFFYDLPKQKQDFELSVQQAAKTIPRKYRTEINYLNTYISGPKFFLYLRFYFQYYKKTKFKKLNAGFINKLKIMSPLGFNAIVNQQKQELETIRKKDKKIDVDSNSGYF